MHRFVGIDIGSEKHAVAAVDENGVTVLKPTVFTENGGGYEKLRGLLGDPTETHVAMEATGHYWKNLFAALVTWGFEVALLNPMRTRRFADEDLGRTKTDAIDALRIARFAREKRPEPTRVPERATAELRELVRLRERLKKDFGERLNQLHRAVDLGFPEFLNYVRTLESELATSILTAYPTAQAFAGISMRRLANLRYDGKHRVGEELAQRLITGAASSVGAHHGEPYRLQVRYACEDLDVLRRRLKSLDADIERQLAEHEVGTLLTTIDGIGPLTAALLIAELGDPAEFKSADALASYVGLTPALRQSGKKTTMRARISHIGNARLRARLWMPTIVAVTYNPWLRAFYLRLRSRGKPAKVALVASMRKLLAAIYSVARARKPFVPILTPGS